MAGAEQDRVKPSEQRGGSTPGGAEAQEKGEWAGTAADGIVPAELGGSDAPRELLDEDPQLGSDVLGRTTGSDEPATEDGIDRRGRPRRRADRRRRRAAGARRARPPRRRGRAAPVRPRRRRLTPVQRTPSIRSAAACADGPPARAARRGATRPTPSPRRRSAGRATPVAWELRSAASRAGWSAGSAGAPGGGARSAETLCPSSAYQSGEPRRVAEQRARLGRARGGAEPAREVLHRVARAAQPRGDADQPAVRGQARIVAGALGEPLAEGGVEPAPGGERLRRHARRPAPRARPWPAGRTRRRT